MEKQKVTKPLETQNLLDKIDFSSIPSSDAFKETKVKPPRRWFNSFMALEILISGSCIGVIIMTFIIRFSSN